MRIPQVNDHVRLVRDIPELSLNRGDVGIVRSHWCAPELAFEVEFRLHDTNEVTRALLMSDQIIVEENGSDLVERSDQPAGVSA
ncbi:MAG: hypothetical protein KatS3mg104_2542 [Phycisphaerae bacterium]|jgi:hypothetical protein|nr:MAG: hypothetical protein KatS3mg104_2542 [Phycisphaerae bacterium]